MLIRFGKLVYRGSEYEFSSKGFYNSCNGVTNCLAIVKSVDNKLVGGFSPLPFVYHDEEEIPEGGIYAEDKTRKSFIFNISSLRSYSVKDHQKTLKYTKESRGPSFNLDLQIGENVTSNLGHSYECDSSLKIDSL